MPRSARNAALERFLARLARRPPLLAALSDWFDAGIAKVCVYVDSEDELLDIAAQGRERNFIVALIRDAGLTEFHGKPTHTCLAFEPLHADEIDPITGELPLY